jgi:hypothetical protein
MPALMEDAEREALSRQLYGSTQERMARELAGVLEALTAESPLVLWLEDLHWSDLSTGGGSFTGTPTATPCSWSRRWTIW